MKIRHTLVTVRSKQAGGMLRLGSGFGRIGIRLSPERFALLHPPTTRRMHELEKLGFSDEKRLKLATCERGEHITPVHPPFGYGKDFHRS